MILLANAVKIILLKPWEGWAVEHPSQQLPFASAFGTTKSSLSFHLQC